MRSLFRSALCSGSTLFVAVSEQQTWPVSESDAGGGTVWEATGNWLLAVCEGILDAFRLLSRGSGRKGVWDRTLSDIVCQSAVFPAGLGGIGPELERDTGCMF